MKKCIVTVLGEDTVGIIAKVCTYLAENEINILLWMIISINLDRKSFHRQYSNLQTAFKKQFGMPPNEYRRKRS